jgi:hypothetical protein
VTTTVGVIVGVGMGGIVAVGVGVRVAVGVGVTTSVGVTLSRLFRRASVAVTVIAARGVMREWLTTISDGEGESRGGGEGREVAVLVSVASWSVGGTIGSPSFSSPTGSTGFCPIVPSVSPDERVGTTFHTSTMATTTTRKAPITMR